MTEVPWDVSSAKVTYEWHCTRCGTRSVEEQTLLRGQIMIRPGLPYGWRRLDDTRFLCPLHKVTVLVDGEVILAPPEGRQWPARWPAK